MHSQPVRQVVLIAAMLAPPALHAVEPPAASPPMRGIVTLSSSATADVARDLLGVTFSTTREGTDAGQVQAQLKQALDTALAEARKVARPQALEVRAGNFELSPRYAAKNGQSVVDGWRGRAELIVEGRDIVAIGELVGRISSLTVSQVGYAISRELRERTTAELTAKAITRYRGDAASIAKAFGFAGYAIREVNVSTDALPPGPRPGTKMLTMPRSTRSSVASTWVCAP